MSHELVVDDDPVIADLVARLLDRSPDVRSPDVRSAAARALGEVGVGMALLDLRTDVLPALREALLTGPPATAALAAGLLGLHGDLSAAPALGVVLRDGGRPLEVRRAAAEALGRIAAPQATDALSGVLAFARDPLLRRAAAEALGRIGDPAALPALVAGLAADDLLLRATCADALVATGLEGRTWLEQLAVGTGPGALAARGALAAQRALVLGRRSTSADAGQWTPCASSRARVRPTT